MAFLWFTGSVSIWFNIFLIFPKNVRIYNEKLWCGLNRSKNILRKYIDVKKMKIRRQKWRESSLFTCQTPLQKSYNFFYVALNTFCYWILFNVNDSFRHCVPADVLKRPTRVTENTNFVVTVFSKKRRRSDDQCLHTKTPNEDHREYKCCLGSQHTANGTPFIILTVLLDFVAGSNSIAV